MPPALELADVTFRRDGKQIIDGISLIVHAGEHWALLGPNGAGNRHLRAPDRCQVPGRPLDGPDQGNPDRRVSPSSRGM